MVNNDACLTWHERRMGLDKASTARARISAKPAGRPLMAHQGRGRGPRLPPEEFVGAPVPAQLATVPPCLSAPSAQLVQLVYLEYDHRLQICEDMQPSLEHRAISSPRGSGNRFSLRTRTLVSSHPESAPDGCKTLASDSFPSATKRAYTWHSGG